MDTYFSADFHFGHDKIRFYCSRPFTSLKEMDSTIINNLNTRIKKEDTLFVLGDFCFSRSTEAPDSPKSAFSFYRDQINCQNIIFINGNHDVKGRNGLKTTIDKVTIHLGGRRINLVHNPEHADTRYEINLVGHVHNNWEIQRKKMGEAFTDCINVGVDVWKFFPVSINEILARYSKWLKGQKQ